MQNLVHAHTIGADDSIGSRLYGAIAFCAVWGLGEFIGPASPLLLAWSFYALPLWVTIAFASAMAYGFVVPERQLYSPRFCRFALAMAGWLRHGSTLWATEEVAGTGLDEGCMVAIHPHGMIPLGFTLNGAIRVSSRRLSHVLLPSLPPLHYALVHERMRGSVFMCAG